jgi:hypothetical protein
MKTKKDLKNLAGKQKIKIKNYERQSYGGSAII